MWRLSITTGYHPAMRASLWFLLLPCVAGAADPDQYDPILDAPPKREHGTRLDPPAHQAAGFTISGHLGFYGGDVRSRLQDEYSGLESSARFNVGFGFGYRSRTFVEVGLDVDLGLGQTWEPEIEGCGGPNPPSSGCTVFAFDLLFEPRVLMHIYETDSFSFYAGPAAHAILFDVELEGLNQAGVGPAAVLGILYRWDSPRHSPSYGLVYLEVSGSYFYDSLAYHFEEPTEEDLEEDPLAEPEKVHGDWFKIFRATVGYRLTSF